jgi:hypothetical protein
VAEHASTMRGSKSKKSGKKETVKQGESSQ